MKMNECVAPQGFDQASCVADVRKCETIEEDRRFFRVELEDARIRKPFLGGWRHRISQQEFVHAESQTGPRRMPSEKACSAATQYVSVKNVSKQTSRTNSTQMWRRDCYVRSDTDRYLKVQNYETAEKRQARLDVDGKARIIQRNYRAYRIRKLIRESAQKYRDLLNEYKKFKEKQALMNRERHRRELVRKMQPRSRSDFDMLYELIDKWRQDRLECTKGRFFRAARCAENCAILEKTVEMYGVIEAKRSAVKREDQNRKRAGFLARHCKPLKWKGYKNLKIEMFTLRVQRARELRAVYNAMLDGSVSREERLARLLALRSSLDWHNCIGALNLTRLLDQEIQLLAREVDGLKLDYLRERIIYSYLWFLRASHECGCSDGNKGDGGGKNSDKRNQRQKREEELREPLEVRTKLCKSCLKLVPFRRFAVHSRMKKLSVCTGCNWLQRRSLARRIYNPYMYILNCVRAEETRRKSESALAFMMQEQDIFHLVNNIWHGHSIVSENNDLYILRLARYCQDEDWSPWNCILLTEDEAEAHTKINDFTTVYSKHLRHRIFLAQQLAKNHFNQLSRFEKNLRDCPISASAWTDAMDEQPLEGLMDSNNVCGVQAFT